LITLYQLKQHKRSAVLINACKNGLEAAGHPCQIRWEDEYNYPEGDVAVFYGYTGNNIRVMQEYPTAIYLDLGYWGRVSEHRYDGYHKISVNARHPTEYFQKKKHNNKRLNGISVDPWKMGDFILVTGMSAKGAEAEGYKPQEWETNAVQAIKDHTSRPIIYRPKPSWGFAGPILGAEFRKEKTPFPQALINCHAVVAHHSNCAVEALLHGVPSFVMDGVAKPLSYQNLSYIEDPYYPEDRYQWACDLSWTHFTTEELSTRLPWDHLEKEGFL